MNKSLCFLGIGGTLMGSVAILAKELGYTVFGLDNTIYPPMSNLLEKAAIPYTQWGTSLPKADMYIVGNILKRGDVLVEELLNSSLAWQSAPEWLADNVLSKRKVIAVAGTHGKTTVTALLAYTLRQLGCQAGFIVGGYAPQLGTSAHIGNAEYFVVEADEYDCAFSDKRAKFQHYLPTHALITKIEYDHADIYPDLLSIYQQFHQWVRKMPGNATVFFHQKEKSVEDLLAMGMWSQSCAVLPQESIPTLLIGEHNQDNLKLVLAVGLRLGYTRSQVLQAMAGFSGAARRQEHIGQWENYTVYDDFAHHPTAIRLTIAAFRSKFPTQKIIVLVDVATNSMKKGTWVKDFANLWGECDQVYIANDGSEHWLQTISFPQKVSCFAKHTIVAEVAKNKVPAVLVMMSNGAFSGVRDVIIGHCRHKKLADDE